MVFLYPSNELEMLWMLLLTMYNANGKTNNGKRKDAQLRLIHLLAGTKLETLGKGAIESVHNKEVGF